MKRIVQEGKTIYQARYIDYPKVYEALLGKKPNLDTYRLNGKIDGLGWTDFLEKYNLDVQCWDSIHSYARKLK